MESPPGKDGPSKGSDPSARGLQVAPVLDPELDGREQDALQQRERDVSDGRACPRARLPPLPKQAPTMELGFSWDHTFGAWFLGSRLNRRVAHVLFGSKVRQVLFMSVFVSLAFAGLTGLFLEGAMANLAWLFLPMGLQGCAWFLVQDYRIALPICFTSGFALNVTVAVIALGFVVDVYRDYRVIAALVNVFGVAGFQVMDSVAPSCQDVLRRPVAVALLLSNAVVSLGFGLRLFPNMHEFDYVITNIGHVPARVNNVQMAVQVSTIAMVLSARDLAHALVRPQHQFAKLPPPALHWNKMVTDMNLP